MNGITQYLGGNDIINHSIDTKMDLLEIANEGITKQSIIFFSEKINLSLKSLAGLLDISARTIQRRSDCEPLSREISEHILQLAHVYSRGEEVFGNLKKFNQWLNCSCIALDNKTPLSLLNSRYGIEMVIDELGKIEYGVYA